MKRIFLLLSISFLFVRCDWVNGLFNKNDQKLIETKMPVSVKFKKELLFTESFLVKQFYNQNNYKTIWFDQKNRIDFIYQIISLRKEGIVFDKTDVSSMFFGNLHYDKLTFNERISVDFVYTNNFLVVIKNLINGKINPNKYYSDWVLPQKKIDLNQILIEATSNNKVDELIIKQIPNNDYYNGLKEAIVFFENLPKDTLVNIKSSDIADIKKKLNYFQDSNFADFNDIWDDEAKEALQKFQSRHGLIPTGKINEVTLGQLNISKDKRLKQLYVNLERARWFYNDLGENYVLVNLPECKLFLYENKMLIDSHDVIIGKNERRTPVLSSTFSNLVINPTWTVPPTILKNDLVPNASVNRSYFASHRMTIFDKKGKVVDPSDWNPSEYKKYRYVQKSGANNALGLIKFDFPNAHSVYLHDTNNKLLFGREKRDLSSGCVRVKDPFSLATRILEIEGSSYDRMQLDTLVAHEKTKVIPLKNKVNVHQLYWTAWKNDQGVQFRNDIYSLDEDLYKKLTN